MDIIELLAFSAKQGASDLHVSAGLPPMIRVDGDVRRINLPPLEHQEVHGLIYEIMNDKQHKDFEEFLEADFSFCLCLRLMRLSRARWALESFGIDEWREKKCCCRLGWKRG